MKNRFLSLLCVLALCLGLLPVGPVKRISRREITTYTTTAKAP